MFFSSFCLFLLSYSSTIELLNLKPETWNLKPLTHTPSLMVGWSKLYTHSKGEARPTNFLNLTS